MKLYPLLFFGVLLLCLPCRGEAQSVPVGDPVEEYVRFLYLEESPSFNLRPVSGHKRQGSGSKGQGTRDKVHPWQGVGVLDQSTDRNYGLFTPSIRTTFNSELPVGQNDGALWQGRGVNSAVSLGGFLDYGPLKVSFRPVLTYSQNRDFELSPFNTRSDLSEFAPPFARRYDAPQRFGDESISRLDLGESAIELQYGGVAAGVSNRNIWVGPAIQNPIQFSNNAPGFLHGFIGTYRPVQTPIGNFEGKILWGGLHESDYFDDDPSNNMRYINSLVLNYSPSFIPGLHLGAVRTYQLIYPEAGLDFSEFFLVAIPFTKDNFVSEDRPSGNDAGYQMLTLLWRWAFPDSGFEIYGEWGRNDHARDNRDLSIHLTHSRSFVLGGVKRWEFPGNRWLVLNGEWTQMSNERGGSSDLRRHGVYYTNNTVIHGFTHRGQLLGSGIAPGSDSQLGKVRLYDRWGKAGLSINRLNYYPDRLDRYLSEINSAQEGSYEPHELYEVEYRFGLHGLFFLPNDLELQADLYQSYFNNRHNIHGNDVTNMNVQVTLRYKLPGFAR